jgi:uncharacterized integral membrane protein
MAPTQLTPNRRPQAPGLDGGIPLAPDRSTPDDARAERQRERDTRRQSPQQPPAGTGPQTSVETRGARFARKAHRGRLHLYTLIAVLVLVYVVALAASNTAHVTVNWVFGSSSVALVWLVLFAAILGWVVGTLTTALFRWRTRRPRPQ